MSIPHAYGRLQFAADLELFFGTPIGSGANPKAAAVVVMGIAPGRTSRVVDGIAETRKPVEGLAIEGNGDIDTIAAANRKAKDCLQWASELRREEHGLSDLQISVKCGESDTTSGLAANPTIGNLIDELNPLGATTCSGETSEITAAEGVCASRAKTLEVAKKFMDARQAYTGEVIEPHRTNELSESQPIKGNNEGGSTAIEEKAFGNL